MRLPLFLFSLALAAGSARADTIGYFQVNLTSDIPGMAANLDPLLKNPWGVSFGLNTPFWVSDQASDVSTLYNGAGVPQALIVSTPPAPGPGPTGQVATIGAGFTTAAGVSPNFVFSTLAGTIDAWNAGTSAITQFTAPSGTVYTGLALLGGRLYAADTANGKIDVFNNTFQPTTVTGTFTDSAVPSNFTPYNIQTVGGRLYVEYANRVLPGGFVAVYDADGNLQQHISDSHLDSPWGVTLAPAGFGPFANDLLVGNFHDGKINVFNPSTGVFIGTISDEDGHPIVNSGLWALEFRSPASTFDSNALFFTAGINGEQDGLFGEIETENEGENQHAPEPATFGSFSIVALGALVYLARRRHA